MEQGKWWFTDLEVAYFLDKLREDERSCKECWLGLGWLDEVKPIATPHDEKTLPQWELLSIGVTLKQSQAAQEFDHNYGSL